MHRSLLIGPLLLLAGAGCAKLAVEGGDKPIHIIMDVNVRVAKELDEFYAFEDKYTGPAPATQPVPAPPTNAPL